MAVNKAFYCGVVSAIADTVSVQGVPVPGPNPQTNSKEGQGQPLPLLSLGIKAEELYLTLKLYSSRLHVGGFDFAVRDEKLYLTYLKVYSYHNTLSNLFQSALIMAILQIVFIVVFAIEPKVNNAPTGEDKGMTVQQKKLLSSTLQCDVILKSLEPSGRIFRIFLFRVTSTAGLLVCFVSTSCICVQLSL